MDFITGLPPSKFNDSVFDSVLVIVDRFTKMARYVHTTKGVDAEGLADLFMEHVVKDFGVPDVTSDRGTVFTSNFWSKLCFILGVKRRLSTAFHPQSDGQTENLNQTLEQYLRCYCNYQQDDWATKLAMAEFVYNSSEHSTIAMTPFYACYGFHPKFNVAVEGNGPEGEAAPNRSRIPDAPRAQQRLDVLKQERERLSARWQKAIASQKKYHDRKTLDVKFKKGQQVMLRAKHLRQLRPNHKLADRYMGPFEVLEVIGEHQQAYRLALPSTWKNHPVFHISLLEPSYPRDGVQYTLPAIEVEGDLEWEVESVVDHRDRVVGRSKVPRREYLVKWKSYPVAENTWEPSANLEHVEEAVGIRPRILELLCSPLRAAA